MLKTLSAVALLTMAGAAFAQSTPSVTPSQTPSVTPSQTPAVTPSQTPSVTPSQTPSLNSPASVGGLSKCENMIGTEKDKCRQDERAGMGSTGSTGSGTMAPQNTAPGGSVR